MKPKKAIKTIEVAKAECEWNAPLDYQGAFDVAIEAIKKQVPKKTIKPDSPYFRHACPSCGNYPLSGKYCGECGQRVLYDRDGEG